MCAKSLQSCPTLCNPMDCSPPGPSVHGDSLGKKTGAGCHFLLQGNLPNISYVSFICRRVLYHKRHLGLSLFPPSPKEILSLRLNLSPQ